MQIIGVKPDELKDIGHALKWHFDSFIERSRGEENLDHLIAEVMSGHRQCWVAWDGKKVRACGLTQVLDHDIKIVEFGHCAGEGREDWAEMMVEELMRWAKHIGAKRFRTINRPGHTKMLKSMGFKETHRILEQDL